MNDNTKPLDGTPCILIWLDHEGVTKEEVKMTDPIGGRFTFIDEYGIFGLEGWQILEIIKWPNGRPANYNA